MIKKFNYPHAPPRPRLVLNTDAGKVGVSLPQDGETSSYDHIERFFSEVLNGLAESYAPRRMVKIGHPSSPRGLRMKPGATIEFPVPATISDGLAAPISFLITRPVSQGLDEDTRDKFWNPARLETFTLGSAIVLGSTVGSPKQCFRLYVQQELGGQTNKNKARISITSTFDKLVELRGAIYFPKASGASMAQRADWLGVKTNN